MASSDQWAYTEMAVAIGMAVRAITSQNVGGKIDTAIPTWEHKGLLSKTEAEV